MVTLSIEEEVEEEVEEIEEEENRYKKGKWKDLLETPIGEMVKIIVCDLGVLLLPVYPK